MNENFKDIITSNRAWAVLSLAFAVYTAIWAIAEPLSIAWINGHIILWRTMHILVSVLGGVLLSLPFTSMTLQTIDANGGDTTLHHDYRGTGTPMVTIEADGNFGNVGVAKCDYVKDALEWDVRPVAQKAERLEFVFNHWEKMNFYLQVQLVSKTGDAVVRKRIRFDNEHRVPDIYQGQEEMAIPYEFAKIKNFQKVTIDIRKAVKETFGQGGWEYGKTLVFGIRGNVTMKSIVFKK